MPTLQPQIKIDYELTLKLNETEARALDALVGYGHEAFLKVFYEQLGKSYMQPHEAGLIALFKAIKDQVPGQLRWVDAAKSQIQKSLTK